MADLQRVIRSVVWFVVGLVLGTAAVVAHSDEYPAVWWWWGAGGLVQEYGPAGDRSPGVPFVTSIRDSYLARHSGAEMCGALEFPDPATWVVNTAYEVFGMVAIGGGACQRQFMGDGGFWDGSCLAGGTPVNVNGVIMCTGAPACTSNYVRNELGICMPPDCPPGKWHINGQCVDPPCGTGVPYGDERYTYNPVTDRCTLKCSVALSNVSLTLPSGAAGKDFCMWAGGWSYCRVRAANIGLPDGDGGVRYPVTPVSDNSFCESATAPDVDDPDPEEDPELEVDNPANPDDEPLPDDFAGCVRRGGTWGTFNGTGMCLERGTPGGMPTETTDRAIVDNGDGTTTTTTTTTRTDGDGNVTVIRTIVTEGNGQTITEGSTVTGDRPGICSQFPNLAICLPGGGFNGGPLPGNGDGSGDGSGGGGGDSVFGGSCEAGFQCDGDAIQCAIALEQHRRNCELFSPNDGSDTYASAMAGEDPGQVALDPANREEVALDSIIDDSSFLGGTCIEDRDFSVMGQTITIPLSSLCPYLDYMGMIVLAFAMLAAMRILFV